MNRPDSISVLDQKPGKDWSNEEVERARRWWMEREQERLIWIAATRYLGPGSTKEDIEELWVSFYAEEIDKSRRSFRPGGPDFATYTLHVCFRRECIRRGEQVRKRLRSESSLEAGDTETGPYERNIADTGPNPVQQVEQKALIEEIVKFLDESKMPLNQKRAFTLKHFGDKSNEEIASELRAEIGTVKVWVHRVAQKVHAHLRRKEWVN